MTITRLKLSHFPATRSARVLWTLHEAADCPVEVEIVNLYGGAQYRPDYLARNPNHNVPLLEITRADGSVQVMQESAAMILFLADAFPAAGIAPPPGASAARADYLHMLQFGGGPMDMMLWQVRIHTHVLPEDARDARTIARYRAKFESEIETQLAARLEHQEFICGDTFTAADCMIGHSVTWARGYGLCQASVFRRYLSRVSKRPAFAKAFADTAGFTLQPPASGSGRPSPFNG
jgi:glutathione S-transferase